MAFLIASPSIGALIGYGIAGIAGAILGAGLMLAMMLSD